MDNRKRLIRCGIGALVLSTWATLGAGTAPGHATGAGCRGLSPASAQDCTAAQIRAALDERP